MVQLVTGFFLTFYYTAHVNHAFNSVIYLILETNYGWILRYIHINFASLFFVVIYIHIFRNIFIDSIKFKKVWSRGYLIYFLLIIIAFIGYVLVWGQISLWGATVITNLLSVFIKGEVIVIWIWGRFSVNNPILQCFFSLHFILPFVLLILSLVHFYLLHQKGSNNSIRNMNNTEKVKFDIYFIIKDINRVVFIIFFVFLVFIFPNIFSDPENFIKANYISSPIHIQPEWYFLYIYAVLRSIPNKLGGVLVSLVILLIIYLLLLKNYTFNRKRFFLNKFINCTFVLLFLLLTWIGIKPVEFPFITLGITFTVLFYTTLIILIAMRYFLNIIIL